MLSVVVLGFRNGPFLGEFVARLVRSLEGVEPRFEVLLVVNDYPGSIDTSRHVARAIAASDARLRLVDDPKQGRMGWDLRRGLERARGRAVAFIDGDGQMPAEDVAAAYRRLCQGDVDLVTMKRVQRGDGRWRRVVSVVFNVACRALFPGLGCSDVNAKPKILTREALRRMRLSSDGWSIDAEVMIQASGLGLRTAELPTTFAALEGRTSFVRPSAICEVARDLLWLRLRGLQPEKRQRRALV